MVQFKRCTLYPLRHDMQKFDSLLSIEYSRTMENIKEIFWQQQNFKKKIHLGKETCDKVLKLNLETQRQHNISKS